MAKQGNLLSKTFVIGIIILFIGMSIVPSSSTIIEKKPSIPSSKGKTLYVGGSVDTQCTKNYSTIQDAIDNASDGDTVFVYDDSSPYYENVLVYKGIKLIGENRDTTVINTIGLLNSAVCIHDNVTVSGFTIIGDPGGELLGGPGIEMRSDNNIIQNNKIIFCTDGIYIDYDSNYNTINNNIIVHNKGNGILEDSSESGNTITWNVIADNAYYYSYRYGLYKHRGIGYYHHNDFYMNCVHAYDSGHGVGIWDDGSEGNYWDDWESNPGYPEVYIIPGLGYDGIDRYPSSTPYFDYPIVKINYDYYAEVNELIYFSPEINVDPSSVSWFWDFGDGNTSNQMNTTHKYSSTGRYSVNVTVTDDLGRTDTSKSTAIIGLPPSTPIINGPTSVRSGRRYSYTFVSTDPDDDQISYDIAWAHEDYLIYYEYVGPCPSGEEITLYHSWSGWWGDNGCVYASAKDTAGLCSNESWVVVTIPRTKATTYSLFQLLFNRFPLLEVFLRAMNQLR